MTEEPRQIGFEHLDRQEQAACLIAARSLGAVEVEAWDVPGRSGAVDAMLTLPDGRRAAFEVTNLGTNSAFELAGRLARDNYKWSVPGNWFWHIEVGSPEDLRRLKGCYENIILTCERAGEPYPEKLAERSTDPDVQWLVHESSSVMTGYPNIDKRWAMVTPVGGGGVVDESLSGFAAALATAFTNPNIVSHFDKLANAEADERHLYIPLHDSGLPFPIFTELVFADTLPPDPPTLPEHVTCLWLAPAASRRVLVWSRAAGWRNVPSRSE
ncbi:hypothetical protein [Mycobacterium paraintracellulare]|uniref:hypothetical protein n=1 Tax=Mycobacterium paraintracellulare TaxID=1138383 RepID=UPI001928DFE9|nr:hypothetical protein [Mycobacterium paraintracellulare]BCP15679.1 hypothetical protein MINTM021_25880 [Mycobacterium paraintracellulare]